MKEKLLTIILAASLFGCATTSQKKEIQISQQPQIKNEIQVPKTQEDPCKRLEPINELYFTNLKKSTSLMQELEYFSSTLKNTKLRKNFFKLNEEFGEFIRIINNYHNWTYEECELKNSYHNDFEEGLNYFKKELDKHQDFPIKIKSTLERIKKGDFY